MIYNLKVYVVKVSKLLVFNCVNYALMVLIAIGGGDLESSDFASLYVILVGNFMLWFGGLSSLYFLIKRLWRDFYLNLFGYGVAIAVVLWWPHVTLFLNGGGVK